MTPPPHNATVYAFHVYGAQVESPQVAKFKATPEAIRELEGELLEGTGEEVARSEIDEQGRYRRLATGWGELD